MSKVKLILEEVGPRGFEEAATILTRHVSARHLLVIFCRCSIEYRGRSRSVLPEGDRLVMVKTNHSVIVHRPEGYSPVNWQPGSSKITFSVSNEENGKLLVMTSLRENPREYLWIRMTKIYSVVSAAGLTDDAKFSMYVSEKEIKDYIEKHPDIIRKGVRIVAREYRTKAGIVDILASDDGNNIIVIEVKDERASLDAAKQLYRYVKHLEKEHGKVKGILFAPSVTRAASEFLERHGLEKILYDPQDLMKKYIDYIEREQYKKKDYQRTAKLTDFIKT